MFQTVKILLFCNCYVRVSSEEIKSENECSVIDKTEVIDWSLNDLRQDDPKLIQILKEKYLIGPNNKALNLTHPPSNKALEGQFGQPLYLDENIFK
jgi:hypothetical protein